MRALLVELLENIWKLITDLGEYQMFYEVVVF
jgi:hypothetical protein